MNNYILGLDIGIASVGWAVVSSENASVVESGVRLFTSAEAQQNQDRRSFRGVRRNKRRRAKRLHDTDMLLSSYGFFKPEFIDKDPLSLRVKGLSERLGKEELYAALFNIVKHRGVSYLEDIEEVKENDSVLKNINSSEFEYPCQIQMDRYKKYGFYRGTHVIDDITLINTFTIGMYAKEAEAIIKKQREFYNDLNDEFVEKFVKLLKRKREYFIGPGNDKSRTNYGVFKTNGETKDNLFDELRGACSIYSGKKGMDKELRSSGASYTSQYYNLLNDLCNIKHQGEKLTRKQKEEVLEYIKSQPRATKIRKVLSKMYNYKESDITGFRIDKNDKDENHSFEIYRVMRNFFSENNVDITKYSIETLDAIADILTINTETDGMLSYFDNTERVEYAHIKELTKTEINLLIELRRSKGKFFTKWNSFSYRAIKQIVPEMLESGDEQHTCITRMKLIKHEDIKRDKLNPEDIVDEIYNPVVSRAIRQTILIVNTLMKKYNFNNIVVEMPRDRNSDEQKQNIKNMQKNLEDKKRKALAYAGLTEEDLMMKKDKKLLLKLILSLKQQGVCAYSGEQIDITELLNNPGSYEVDHIIPISICFDDSQSNKVLVKSAQNSLKGQMTPFQYLSSTSNGWSYEQYKAYVLELYKGKHINKKQKDLMLCEEDINKQDVIQGFISRNINDTRYASRVVLNELQYFFKNAELDTKVKVINGTLTNQLRKQMKFKKDRDLDFRHHAQDAMICCYTLLTLIGHENDYVNIETGEIINKENFKQLSKKDSDTFLTYNNLIVRGEIESATPKIKFSHKIDTKVNRAVSDQTIYSTREKDDKCYVVSKIKDIYDEKEYKDKYKKRFDTKADDFLMKQHDPQTWQILMDIIKMYPDYQGNPFNKYRDEFGPIKKYSKKGNGPVIKEMKYLDHAIGSNLDITHKYEGTKNKVILESLKHYRADLFYNTETKGFYLIPIRRSDFKFIGGKYVLPIERYQQILIDEKVLKSNETFEMLEQLNIEFKFSLYRDNIVELVKEDSSEKYRFVAKNHNHKNYFEVKYIDTKISKRVFVSVSKQVQHCFKYNVDILGNEHKIENEKLVLEFKLDNKMIK